MIRDLIDVILVIVILAARLDYWRKHRTEHRAY
jgi:hypothetical protein